MMLLSEEIQLVLLTSAMLCIPGMGLLSFWKKNVSLVEAILYSTILGLFWWVVLSSIGFLFSMSLITLVKIWVVSAVLLIGILLWKIVFIGTFKIRKHVFSGHSMICATAAILLSLLMAWKGSYQDGDSWYHLAQTLHYFHQSALSSESAFFSSHQAGTLYDFNAWHTFLAAISRLGNFTPQFVWINLSTLIMPIAFLSVYHFIQTAFRSISFSLFAALFIFATNFLQHRFLFLGTVIYPSALCEVFLTPVFFTIFFNKTDSKDFAILCAILFTASAIHPYYSLVIIFIASVFYLFNWSMNNHTAPYFLSSVKSLFYFFLFVSPYLSTIYLYTILSYEKGFPGTEISLFHLTKSKFIFSFSYDKWDFYLALSASFFLILKNTSWRTDRYRLFVISNILIVPFIIYNPYVLPIFAKLAPLNLAGRLTGNIFILIPIAWILFEEIQKIQNSKFKKSIYTTVLLIGALLGIAILVKRASQINVAIKRITHYNKYAAPMGNLQFSRDFHQSIPGGSTVISDPYTSYQLPALADIDIVSMTAHSTPPLNLEERIRDTYHFFDPFVPMEEKHALVRKYKIDYAVINTSALPYVSIPPYKLVFSGNRYPNWRNTKDNTFVVTFNSAPIQSDTEFLSPAVMPTISQPNFTQISDFISVFPPPDTFNAGGKELTWGHAGTIFIKVESSGIDQLQFNSQGSTHHVFCYIIHDWQGKIKNEQVFINNLSSSHTYTLEGLSQNDIVLLHGNGISPLMISINPAF